MKDLFCLVNAFINRTKSDPAAKTSGSGGDDGEGTSSSDDTAEGEELIPTASSGRTHKGGAVLASLEPFLHMLPIDLDEVDSVALKDQRHLHRALYSAGVSAALSLHKFLYEPGVQQKQCNNPNSIEMSPLFELDKECGADWKEIFSHLEQFVTSTEGNAEGLRFAVPAEDQQQNVEKLMRNEDGKSLMKMISNEVAAAALAAFSSATYRRPPTKHIESIMCTNEEPDPLPSDDDLALPLPPSLLSSEITNPAQHLMLCPHHQKCDVNCGSGGQQAPLPLLPPPQLRRRRSSTQTGTPSIGDTGEGKKAGGECECSGYDEVEDRDLLFRYACAAGHDDLASLLIRIRKSTEFAQKRDSTPLMEAACGGHASVVRSLIEAGADVNALSSSRNTALIYACAAGHVECVRELLKSGRCDLNTRNENSHCALMEAASTGNLEIVKLLIEHGSLPSCVSENLDFKESPITLAAYKGHVDVVEYLITRVPPDADRDEELHTALIEASMDGHLEVARVLLKHGAPVNLGNSAANNGSGGGGNPGAAETFEYGPLTLAACGGHVKLVELLLDHGADIEEPNDEGYTPLMEAAREGHIPVVELLLDRGAKVDAKLEDSETALTLAAASGFKLIVELLITRGADISVSDRALYEAVQDGHAEVAAYIVQQLKQSPNLDQPTLTLLLNEALICAAQINSSTICNTLLDNGAEINHISKEGRSTLMEFSRHGNQPAVESLLAQGAQINGVGAGRECTALSLAAQHGHTTVLRYLLDRGADPTISLKDSSTCLLEASKNGHIECVEILLDHDFVEGFNEGCRLVAESGWPASGATPAGKKSAKSGNGATNSAHSKTANNAITKASRSKNKSAISSSAPAPASKIMVSLQGVAMGGTGEDKVDAEDLKQQVNTEKGDLDDKEIADSSLLLTKESPANASQMFRELAANAAASGGGSGPYNGPDDWLFAQFIQRSLITTKRREAMSEAELRSFTKMVQQEFRTMFPSGQVDTSTLVSSAGQQALNNIYAAAAMLGNGNGDGAGKEQAVPATKPKDSTETTTGDSTTTSGSSSPPNVPCCPHTGQPFQPQQQQSPSSVSGKSILAASPAKVSEALKKSTSAVSQKLADSHELISNKSNADSGQHQSGVVNAASPTSTTTTLTNSLASKSPNTAAAAAAAPNKSHPASQAFTSSTTTTAGTAGTAGGKMSAAKLAKGRKGQQPQLASPHHTHSHKCPNQSQSVCCAGAGALCTEHAATAAAVDVTPAGRVDRTAPMTFVDMQTETNHDTALTLACVGGHATLAALLIKRGADIEHRDKKGFTPLILAATGGHLETCRVLLDAKCQVDAQADRTKDTALSLACSGGRKEVVELLLKAGANKEHRNISDYTPLSLAASGGFVEIIQLLLNAGAEINSRTGSKLGISPLMLSAMNGHEAATALLLENGADINAQIETNKNTALTLACFQGRTEVVRLLLRYGANAEHRAKTGLTPLMEAANGGYVEVGQLLLDSHADVNAPPVPSSRDTALSIAADKGHAAFVEMLIHAEAQINIRNKKGATSLWLACNGGHFETAQCLVKHGADADMQDNRKVSPLMVALRKGHTKVAKYLVRHVTQFPSDAECNRYIASLTDQDLATRCRQCVDFIMAAKARQAEEADKAAKSLLDLLAQEEAKAESKKRSKQRQKEKKRAKKLANKKQEEVVEPCDDEEPGEKEEEEETEGVTGEGAEGEEEEEDGKPVEEHEEEEEDVKAEGRDAEGEEEEEEAEAEEEYTPLPSATEQPQHGGGGGGRSKRQKSGGHKEERVPPAPHSFNPPHPSPAQITSLMDVRVEPPEPASLSSQTSVTTATSKLTRRAKRRGGARNNEKSKTSAADGGETEWSRASRKQKATAAAGAATNKNSSSSARNRQGHSAQGHQGSGQPTSKSTAAIPSLIQSIAKLDAGEIDVWSPPSGFMADSSLSTRRRPSQVLNVNSSAIARVIGRAGSNINAIREATGAHIEVEKMTSRREQATRQVTIRGPQDAIKTAIWMIEKLIEDNDLSVAEIIESAPCRPCGTAELTVEASPPPPPPQRSAEGREREEQTMHASSDAREINKAPASVNEAAAGSVEFGSVPGSNVWQQRAAIREMKKVQKTEQFIDKLVESKPFADFSSHPSTEERPAVEPTTGPTAAAEPSLPAPADERDSVLTSHEELQRKAPGYARPMATSTTGEAEKKAALQVRPLSEIWESTKVSASMDPLSPQSSLLFGSAAGLDPHTAALWFPSLGRLEDSGAKMMGGDEGTTSTTDWTKAFSALEPLATGHSERLSAANWTNDLLSGGGGGSVNAPMNAASGWDSVQMNSSSANWAMGVGGSAAAIGRPTTTTVTTITSQPQSKPTGNMAYTTSGAFSRETTPSNNTTSGAGQFRDGGESRAARMESANSSVIKTYLNSMQQASGLESSRAVRESPVPRLTMTQNPPGMPACPPQQYHYASTQFSQPTMMKNPHQQPGSNIPPTLPPLHPHYHQSKPPQMPPFNSHQQQQLTAAPNRFVHPPPGFGSNGSVGNEVGASRIPHPPAAFYPSLSSVPPPPAMGMGHPHQAVAMYASAPQYFPPLGGAQGAMGGLTRQGPQPSPMTPSSPAQHASFFTNGGAMNSGWGTPPSTTMTTAGQPIQPQMSGPQTNGKPSMNGGRAQQGADKPTWGNPSWGF